MNRLSVATVAAFSAVALTQAAFAADIPTKAPIFKAPVADPAFNWTGFYAGVYAGAGVLFDAGWQQFATPGDRHGIGALPRGQVGYNYQMGMLVLGV